MQLALWQPDEPERDDCRYPGLRPSSAYANGCRCQRCRSARRLRTPGRCLTDGCMNQRTTSRRSQHCAEHEITYHCAACGDAVDDYSRVLPLCAVHRADPFLDQLRRRFLRHGMSRSHQAEWWIRLAALGRLTCPICSEPITYDYETNRTGSRNQQFVIDHAHDRECGCDRRHGCTNCVRGVLHHRCNIAVGFLETSGPDITAAIATYLGWQS
jgi:hypothetical protein